MCGPSAPELIWAWKRFPTADPSATMMSQTPK